MIDLDEWRVCARLHGFNSVHPVAGTHPARMVATTHERESGLYDERGGRVAAPPFDGLKIVRLVAHPDGEGLVAIVAAWEPERVTMRMMTTGLRSGSSSCARVGRHPPRFDGKNQIVAYGPAPAGLQEAWRVEVPELTTLARDPGGRTVLALAPAKRGLDVAVLGPDPAHLDASSLGHLELGRDEAPFLFCAP